MRSRVVFKVGRRDWFTSARECRNAFGYQTNARACRRVLRQSVRRLTGQVALGHADCVILFDVRVVAIAQALS